ncbi:MAG: nucleoside triphosphate pyrophosphohydrolase [Bacteroidia bacterium]
MIEELRELVHRLRRECPWDRAQTLTSLRTQTLEEAHELSQALLEEKPGDIEEELGDLLLHVLFYAELGQEKGLWSWESVGERLKHKLIARHPHIFGQGRAQDAQAVLRQWHAQKRQEKGESLLRLPPSLLPWVFAQRVQEKVSAAGFDWESPQAMIPKLQEETQELTRALELGNLSDVEKEIGDLLFLLVHLARRIGSDAEKALHQANQKFVARWNWIEETLKKQQKTPESCSLSELESYWQASKSVYP